MFLSLDCIYVPSVAGGVGQADCEIFPLYVHTFGTHELRRGKIDSSVLFNKELAYENQTPRNDKTNEFKFSVRLEWKGVASVSDVYAPLARRSAYTFVEVGRKFEPYKISRSARVVFNAYARSMNSDDQMCWVRTGSTSFTIPELRSALNGEILRSALVQNAKDVVRDKHHRDVVRNDSPLIKGEIGILAARLENGTLSDFDNSLLPPQLQFDLQTIAQLRDAAIEMSCVIDREMLTFFGVNACIPASSIDPLTRFHAPSSLRDQLVMIALGYSLNNASKPAPFSFFIRSIEVLLFRRNLTAATLNRITSAIFVGLSVKRAELLALCSFATSVVALFASLLVYIEDFANSNVAGRPWMASLIEIDEDHKIARAECADDCEGLTLETLMLAIDLIERSNDIAIDAAQPSEMQQLFRNVVRVMKLYVPGMKFGAVTNTRFEDSNTSPLATSLTKTETLGHTYSVFIPFDKFIGSQSSESLTRLRQTRAYSSYATQLDLMRRLNLPVLVGEGTAITEGCIMPLELAYEDDVASQSIAHFVCARKTAILDQLRDLLEKTRCQVESFSIPAPLTDALRDNRHDLSNFYKWSNGFTTPIFAESRLMDFAFVYKQNTSCTYGITFTDFVLGTSKRTVETIPTVDISKREAAVIDNILALEEPVPRLLGSDENLNVSDELRRFENRRREPMPSTMLHHNRLLVMLRAQDIGTNELTALRRAFETIDYASIAVKSYRLGRVDLPTLEPIDIVDIIIEI